MSFVRTGGDDFAALLRLVERAANTKARVLAVPIQEAVLNSVEFEQGQSPKSLPELLNIRKEAHLRQKYDSRRASVRESYELFSIYKNSDRLDEAIEVSDFVLARDDWDKSNSYEKEAFAHFFAEHLAEQRVELYDDAEIISRRLKDESNGLDRKEKISLIREMAVKQGDADEKLAEVFLEQFRKQPENFYLWSDTFEVIPGRAQLKILEEVVETVDLKQWNTSQQVEFYSIRAGALLGMNQFDETMQLVNEMVEKYPKGDAAYYYAVQLMASYDQYEEAVAFLERAENINDPKLFIDFMTEVAERMALVDHSDLSYDARKQVYDKVEELLDLSLMPEVAQVNYAFYRALNEFHLLNDGNAIAVFDKLVADLPKNSRAYRKAAQICDYSGDRENALRYAEMGIAQTDDDDGALVALLAQLQQ